jgi:hypothetical protein
MPALITGPETVAAQVAGIRDLLPTSLGTAEIRDAIAADLRARSVFSARATNATFLDAIKMVIDELAAGKTNHATARWYLAETLKELGYDSEAGGFPDAPGEVDPALAGTLQDLRSRTRLDLIIRTQLALVRGRGQQLRGTTPEALRQFPAWELVRAIDRRVKRKWGGVHDGTPPRRGGDVDPRPRWIIAGGKSLESGRLVALKGDPVWGELGASGNFDDALDVDYPPFAFNSGMAWVEISWADARALHVTGPNGESINEWLAMDHPTLVDTQSGIPAPQASVRKLDPAILKKFEESAGIKIVETTATTEGNEDEVRRRIAERRAAREARRAELARQATDKASAAYEERGDG